MGYRSQVLIAMDMSTYKQLNNSFEHAFNRPVTEDFLDIEIRGNEVVLYEESIKWYGDDVDAVEQFLEDLHLNQYLFARIGEDWEDIVCKGLFNCVLFDIAIVRSILH